MAYSIFKKSLVVLLYCFFALSLFHCTSSEDDASVLESEIENIDVDGMEEDLDDNVADIEEVAEEDLVDDLGEGDSSDADADENIAEFDDEELEDELDEELEESNGGDQEVADNDFDEDFDDADFDEFGDDDGDVAQNEKALEQELNQQAQAPYPEAQNAQATFPEEIMGQQAPPPQGPIAAVPSDSVITSETQEIEVPDAMEPSLPQDDLGQADPIVPLDEDEQDSAPSWVPVVKIKTDPFFRNQRLMNAVYIARPGDNFDEISQKLFGSDRTSDLKADNTHLAKGIDPGDKIYYNSPNRPDDRAQLKFFYNDNGLPPQYYTTRSGDNMRRLGSKLLGFPDGWKEVWAINQNVDSKTILPGGVQLRYWTGNESKPSMEISMNDPQEIGNGFENQPAGPSAGTIEEFGEEPQLPQEPPLPEASLPEAQLAAPEPEAVPDIEPFPEEGVVDTPTPTPVASVVPANQNDQLLTVGAMALLVLAGVGLVAIQIKKRKGATAATPQSLEYTQV
ncbi:MAG: hypothetical protein AAF203_02765 [Pseudomonadota bacterium]